MAHLLTWTRIRLSARPSTIYSRYRQGKHHFRWLLRWRNLPVRASPPPHSLLRLTAYLRLASCLSTPGWMCIGIEYRQAAAARRLSSYSLLFLAVVPFRLPPFSFSPPSLPSPPAATSPSATASSSSKSSASSYESCDLIDRIASPSPPLSPFGLSPVFVFARAPFLSFSFYICPRFPFLSRALPMNCNAVTTRRRVYPPRFGLRFN